MAAGFGLGVVKSVARQADKRNSLVGMEAAAVAGLAGRTDTGVGMAVVGVLEIPPFAALEYTAIAVAAVIARARTRIEQRSSQTRSACGC